MIPTAAQIRRQYIDFFVKKYGHKEIPSASLIPENDPTVLFTTAGMHPLVPYLMGEPHPQGKRLVDAQKSLRTDDIDEVGDATHLTFFEMLGNWSLGDYFKEEAIRMSFELLTLPWEKGGYGLPVERLFISCFEGDNDAPRDTESAEIWMKQRTPDGKGIPKEQIYFFPKKKNWWGPAGQTGPCGPDTEMFYDIMNDPDSTKHKPDGRVSQASAQREREASGSAGAELKNKCDPSCDCGRYVEVWNDVFMQYNKKPNGTYEPLKQKNVDTGLGFERMVAVLQGKESPFDTELFAPVMEFLKNHATDRPSHSEAKQLMHPQGATYFTSFAPYISSYRIIADHLRAATFILGDPMGVSPSNVDQGYIVRRLIRRAIRHGKKIGITRPSHSEAKQIVHLTKFFTAEIAKLFIPLYEDVYPELHKNRDRILDELNREEERFLKTLGRGLKELERIIEKKKVTEPSGEKGGTVLNGAEAFYIFETYGFPLEMIEEELAKEGFTVNREQFQKAFDEAFKKHQEISRAGAQQKFAGGLADHTEPTKMHHTATHLVHQALRDVLGSHVFQRGSNVTGERLRFDFSHHTKMTPEQIKKVEEIVNTQIQRDLPVHFEILDFEEAKKRGAIGLFDDKYAQLGNKVKVYFMGDYSKEVCGGPHVEHTGVLVHFKILKEEACSAGIRRIKAVVEGIFGLAKGLDKLNK